jgi:amino acid permease
VTGDRPLFSRELLLGGLPARRATSVVFAIESRTARLVARSRRAVERYVSERATERAEAAFLAAMAEGRDPPIRPTIRDLERHAPDWANLVAPDPSLRASIAHRFAEKYRFRAGDVPRIRTALALDESAVDEAHRRLFDASIQTIYRDRLTARERVAWTGSRLGGRLEDMPPIWTAYALTLTETVGAGVLALPIALAGLGVGPALVLLILFGLVNLLTIAALAESIGRDGAIRYGSAYFGRLVEDYLGRTGRTVLSVALFAVGVLSVPSYILGVGFTLGTVTGTPPLLWAAVLFSVTLAVLRRGSLGATVATAIVIGVANIALLAGISAIALLNLDVGRLTAIPTIAGASTFGLAFGILLGAYFGHTSAVTAAKVVLARDPSGRSLVLGNVAAMATVMVLYAVVVVAIGGAVPAEDLIGFGGTAIEPLAKIAGPSVAVLGGLFVVLAMGLATIITSLALHNQALEVLGDRPAIQRRLQAVPNLRWLLAAVPVIVVFGAVPAMLAAGVGTFSGPLAALGTVATPILAGIFPMLMVLAARRRGEYPIAGAARIVGHPVTVTLVSAIFVAGILVQSWIVSGSLVDRVVGSIVTVVLGVVVVQALRSGAFRPRTVLELRAQGRTDPVRVSVVRAGRDATVPAHQGSACTSEDLERTPLTVAIPATDELEVWAHRVTDEGASLPISLQVGAVVGASSRALGDTSARGRLTAFLDGLPAEVTLGSSRSGTVFARGPTRIEAAGDAPLSSLEAPA